MTTAIANGKTHVVPSSKNTSSKNVCARTKLSNSPTSNLPTLTLDLPRRIPLNVGQPRRANITMVGSGGTGSFLALHLARLTYDALTQRRLDELNLTFVDMDQVEQRNIGRQNFIPAEVGYPKAELLARRYSLAFGLKIRYFNTRFSQAQLDDTYRYRDGWLHLLIGAVDTTAARRDLLAAAKAWSGRLWWLDTGNDDHSGQVLLGNRSNLEAPEVGKLGGIGFGCTGLPLPSVQRPAIVAGEEQESRGAGEQGSEDQPSNLPTPNLQPTASCAEDLLAGYQSLMVNQQVAGIAASYVYRMLILRDLDSYATDFDLQAGSSYSRHILEAK